ncbi:class I mannose-6-phosphate isomerase [Pediococcus parvulus]|uniref:class I mannose-6-phosphate isomerase n=1 Tax=Pediococcus parvulus TaxID=54062 RepID=UPI00345E5D11
MNYDLEPETDIENFKMAVQGVSNVTNMLSEKINSLDSESTIIFECYPGVDYDDLRHNIIDNFNADNVIFADDFAMSSKLVNETIHQQMTDDRVFGIMTHYTLSDFYPQLDLIKSDIKKKKGKTIVYGTGASLFAPNAEITVYCDLARWEIQLRYRSGLSNWQQDNADEDPLRKFKRGYFFDWRMADRLKKDILPKADFVLDTNKKNEPKLVSGTDLLAALQVLQYQPYRTVPYFDASVWGGQWMKNHYKLPENGSNYGWAFDGVPEENSLYFRFGKVRIEVPAMDLMLMNPIGILGEKVFSRFGAEFPIRFDYLDTVKGGNLSLQVHPLTEYIKQHYGMNYTQDESYYILASTSNSSVYLGTKKDIDKENLGKALSRAAEGKERFPDEKFINNFPAKKGDHFLIPAGTIHCGGAGTVVLEISATPYIFTFKMWDWDRVGLDGKPRPIHLEEGLDNIQMRRDTDWVEQNLINQFSLMSQNEDETVERTGLHPTLEFIETLRHTINGVGQFNTHGSVNMLNMVDGNEAVVESLNNNFKPFTIHFGETFIVPEAVGQYTIRSTSSIVKKITVIQAFVK